MSLFLSRPIRHLQVFDPRKGAVVRHQNGGYREGVRTDHDVEIGHGQAFAFEFRTKRSLLFRRR